MLTDTTKADVNQARLYLRNGLVQHFTDQSLCYACWLAIPYSVFRGAGDLRPVYQWEFCVR